MSGCVYVDGGAIFNVCLCVARNPVLKKTGEAGIFAFEKDVLPTTRTANDDTCEILHAEDTFNCKATRRECVRASGRRPTHPHLYATSERHQNQRLSPTHPLSLSPRPAYLRTHVFSAGARTSHIMCNMHISFAADMLTHTTNMYLIVGRTHCAT